MPKIFAVWDKENCDVSGITTSALERNIRKALKACDPTFELYKLIAVGPLSKIPSDVPTSVTSYIGLPRENIPCQAEEPSEGCLTYVVRDHIIKNDKIERTTDIADIIIVMEVFRHVIQEDGKDVLIIAGDADFGQCLRKFAAEKGFNMMLAYPKEGSHGIKKLANHAWMWSSNDPRDAEKVMTNGAGLMY